MEFKILKEKENPLFRRKEIQISLEAQITPNKKEMAEAIAEKFSTQSENISIKGIHGKFGSNIFLITANIYSSREEKEKTEPKSKKKSSPEVQEQKGSANADDNSINKEPNEKR